MTRAAQHPVPLETRLDVYRALLRRDAGVPELAWLVRLLESELSDPHAVAERGDRPAR